MGGLVFKKVGRLVLLMIKIVKPGGLLADLD